MSFELSNKFCEVTDSFAYSSSVEDENREELRLDVCEITPAVSCWDRTFYEFCTKHLIFIPVQLTVF